jgi:hypothetical protein
MSHSEVYVSASQCILLLLRALTSRSESIVFAAKAPAGLFDSGVSIPADSSLAGKCLITHAALV